MKELGVTIGSSNKTYVLINTASKNEVIDKHANFLNKYRLCINEKNKCLPCIYSLAKLHKNLTKVQFIIAVLKYSLKPPFKSITTVSETSFHRIESWKDFFFKDQHILDNFKQLASHKSLNNINK